MSKKIKKDLVWANEVMEVYQNLGSLPDGRSLSTTSARYLFDWAKEDGNTTKFLSDLVPKATVLIEKHTPKEVDDAVAEIDNKTIVELQKFLREVVEDSKKETGQNPSKSQDVEDMPEPQDPNTGVSVPEYPLEDD